VKYKERKLKIMRVVIDRFEGLYAICEKEDRTMSEIEIIKIPKGAKEGDVLKIENEEVTIDIFETKARQKKIADVTNDMWK
jgi:hypothetical protein